MEAEGSRFFIGKCIVKGLWTYNLAYKTRYLTLIELDQDFIGMMSYTKTDN